MPRAKKLKQVHALQNLVQALWEHLMKGKEWGKRPDATGVQVDIFPSA